MLSVIHAIKHLLLVMHMLVLVGLQAFAPVHCIKNVFTFLYKLIDII